MNIELYTFDKKYKSTKQPTLNSGTTYDCYLKTSSSIISPTIELNLGLASNPSQWNYAYISDYGRYYWVTEWTFSGSSWFASLNVDVLASWKPYIGDTSMYIYRSSAEYNGNLIDTKYPTETGFAVDTIDLTEGTQKTKFSDGCYVVGIFGNNSNTSTVCYYVFTPTEFSNLIQSLYATANDSSLWGVIEKGIRNSIMDLSSYIKSCIWLPVSQSSITNSNTDPATTSIDVGAFSITGISCYPLTKYGDNVLYRMTVLQIPKHPQATTRGAYCNCKPYTSYKLVYMPYGVFNLDTLALRDNNYLVVSCKVDPISGTGVMRCFATPTDPNYPVTSTTEVCVSTARVGIELPVLLQSANINAIGGSLLSAGLSLTLGNPLMAGAFAGAVLGGANVSSQPIDKVGNVSGSFGMLNYNNLFESRFFTLVAEDNSANGRPLYAVRQPKNISGYIEGKSDNFSCPATDSEQTEIRHFIDNGFYYE